MPREQKETTFQGKIYSQKERDGTKQRVMDQEAWAAVWADAAVVSAATVGDLKTALADAIAALD